MGKLVSEAEETKRVVISDLVEKGAGPDEIFYRLVEKGVYFIDDEGNLRSHYGHGEPLGGKGGTKRGPLYITAGMKGSSPVKIPAPRLAWMIHTGRQIPEDSSVIQLQGRENYSWDNLALVPKGQESRFAKKLRETRE